jgi:hypothetical protein
MLYVEEEFFLDCLKLEVGTDRLYRNVYNKLLTNTAQHSRRAKASTAPRRKPDISQVLLLKFVGHLITKIVFLLMAIMLYSM